MDFYSPSTEPCPARDAIEGTRSPHPGSRAIAIDDIPADIMDAGLEAWNNALAAHAAGDDGASVIAAAILAEREGCASYIERRRQPTPDRGFIAAAIRRGDRYEADGTFVPGAYL